MDPELYNKQGSRTRMGSVGTSHDPEAKDRDIAAQLEQELASGEATSAQVDRFMQTLPPLQRHRVRQIQGEGRSRTGAVARSATQGAMFEMRDEAVGLTHDVERSRQNLSIDRHNYPVATATAETAGAILPNVIGGAGGIAGRLGRGLFNAVRGGNKLDKVKDVAKVAAVGGAEGGLWGFGSATGSAKERMPNAYANSLMGMGIGAGVAIGGPYAGALATGVKKTAARQFPQLANTARRQVNEVGNYTRRAAESLQGRTARAHV